MKKIFRIILIILVALGGLIASFYFLVIHEKPIDQNALNEFLAGQPIIDVHLHITKGSDKSKLYKQFDADLDVAKLKFTQSELDKNNVVLALAGGPIPYAINWTNADNRIWAGPILPCNPLSTSDQPCDSMFPDVTVLRELYASGTFKSMGELFQVFSGIPTDDPQFDPYWQLAAEFDIPIGIHSSTVPPPAPFSNDRENAPNFDGDAANPELLRTVLKKYPTLRIYLMHYGFTFDDESIALMKDYKNVYCDISAISLMLPKILWENSVKSLYSEGLGDRIMFGSDFTGTIRGNIEKIYSLNWLTDEQKRDIYYNNAANFLRLSEGEIKHHHEMAE